MSNIMVIKKVSKVSLESDSNGVVIHSTINGGNEHDAKIFLRDIHVKYFIDNNLIKYLSKYYSADPAYYTNKILKYLKSKDLIPIIKPNIKNTKDKAKLKKLKLNTYQNKIYGKRFKIEDTNSNIKSFKLVQTRMDCSNNSFESSLFISYINKVQRYL